uniref:HAUS augmin-like complex subunit 3 N-terminal domain-containing protein n=1 Tax=Glossina brevipalpis TaxID=37001 RepID=A0A1A9X2Z9_9MUSC
MGDPINNAEIFKKLNFDTSSQWMFYDERFHKFFDFFANNITDSNILTETEILEQEELLERNEYIESSEKRAECLKEITAEYPGLLTDTQEDIVKLQKSTAAMEKLLYDYDELIKDMRDTKQGLNAEINKLEEQCTLLENKEGNMLSICQSKAKNLEELQSENSKKTSEIAKMFSNIQSPPLFMHQQPLDEYFAKSDSFMQYFSLYLKENFKFQETEIDDSLTDLQENTEKLNSLKKLIQRNELAYFTERATIRGTQCVIDALDLAKVHVIKLSDVERETHELGVVNIHQEIVHNALTVDLENLVRQQTQRIIEMNLLENTKEKLARAQKRQANNNLLSQIVSNVLSNAELIWIGIQLDLEKNHNRFDNSEELKSEAQSCLQRIQLMRSVNVDDSLSVEFTARMTKYLSLHLQQQLCGGIKSCLYAYEKFSRMVNYALNALLNRKHYSTVLEKLEEIIRIESILHSFVYDGPVDAPMFENVRYLKPIFNAKLNKELVEKKLRKLRTQFQENIKERMLKDKLWRYRQLLWVWFLREPSRVLHAIEETKKIASKDSSIAALKTIGIKRK